VAIILSLPLVAMQFPDDVVLTVWDFAGLFGEAGDAPGLVLIGLVLIASACALGLRAGHRSKRALAGG
jgi:hypothetical protein